MAKTGFFSNMCFGFLAFKLSEDILQVRLFSLSELFFINFVFCFEALSDLRVDFSEILNSLLYFQSFEFWLWKIDFWRWNVQSFWGLV